MPGVVYDTGALLAAERNDPQLLVIHRRLLSQRLQPVVPAVVLAQAWRGGPQPRMSLVLKGCTIAPDSELVARAAGALCALSGTGDVVDAIVVITAGRSGSTIITSDPDDIRHLADVLRIKPTIFGI